MDSVEVGGLFGGGPKHEGACRRRVSYRGSGVFLSVMTRDNFVCYHN